MDATALPIPGRRPASVSKRLLALRGDPALVARLRAGDDAAFEVLYERHLSAILSFCRHMLGSPEEAEDAVQNVFVSAHRHLVADARDINLRPWLYAIARNRCLSMLRARREDVVEDVEVSTAGLDEVVEQRADLRLLLADVGDLPENQRAALVLTELGDLSHAEVAEVLECEAGQVKGLVFRARSGLAERREAREASCEDIRVELANARGGGLRRGRLSHHLKACPNCAAYMKDLRSQRRMLALILPVVPTVGLKDSVLGALAAGGGGAAGGGAVAAGGAASASAGLGSAGAAGSLFTASVAKVAAVGVLAAGGGAAIVAGDVERSASPPAQREKPTRQPSSDASSPLARPTAGGRPVQTGARRDVPPVRDRERVANPRQTAGTPGRGSPGGRGTGDRHGVGHGPPLTPGAPGRGATGKPDVPPGQAKARDRPKPDPPRGRSRAVPAPRVPAAPAKPLKKERPAQVVKIAPGRSGKPAE